MANRKLQNASRSDCRRRSSISRWGIAFWLVTFGLAGQLAGHDPPPLPSNLGVNQQARSAQSPSAQTPSAQTPRRNWPVDQPAHTIPPSFASQTPAPQPSVSQPSAVSRPAYPLQRPPTSRAEPIPSVPRTDFGLPKTATSATSAPANPPSLDDWIQPSQASSSLRTIGLLSIISLAPAIALMTTSYVRVAIVLTLLRQGLGAQGLPSNQMISALALFISAAVMSPVWTEVYETAVVPYSDPEIGMPLEDALQVGVQPVRQFMTNQIQRLNNEDDILLFYRYLPEGASMPESFDIDDVPLNALLPAFMLSELKTAFLIGFQVYLPFLILDILVASVTVSMGMFMLPPAYVSLPFKLLLFVMVDGWHLLVEMLLKSFVV